MESFLYDLRHAARGLRQRPLFTAIAALSIAIGIGANTTIFSVINALFLRPPAGIVAPGRVVEVSRTMGGRGRETFSYPEVMDVRADSAAFAHVAGWRWAAMSYADDDGGHRLSAMAVSYNYFDVMGLAPVLGRFFLADEDRTPMTHPVAVVSERFWRGTLAATPDIVGRVIVLNRRSFTVVGVAPQRFTSHMIGFRTDVWVPMMMMGAVVPGFDSFAEREASWLMAVGRLRPGVTPAQAQASLQPVFAAFAPRGGDARNARSAAVDPIGPVPAPGRGPVAAFIGVLLGLTALILLVTCTNVAGMLLARAAAREREIAVRLALGSGRRRLIRQLVVESLLLFTIGGAAGVVIALSGTLVLSAIRIPAPLPFELNLSPDARVVAAGLVLALITGLIFGTVPAVQATRPDLTMMMKASGFATGRAGRMRRVFVMGQVGFSMVLLLSAGLFLRSLQRAASVPAGFDPTGVHVVQVDLETNGYDEASGRQFVRQLLSRLEATPGVLAASTAEDLPLDLGRTGGPAFVDSPAANEEGWIDSEFSIVSPGYFEALEIAVRRGRSFGAGDVEGAEPVAMVSRTFAERAWPGEEALGRTLKLARDGAARRIVGVVDDVKNSTVMEPPANMYYLPLGQEWAAGMSILVRARGDEGARVLPAVLREADRALAVSPVQSMEAIAAVGLLPQRLAAAITTSLGVLALVLSAMGVYGVIAYMVTQRTREIGVRVALGARSSDVRRLVLGGGLRLALPGLVFGLAAGTALSFVLRGFILGIGPADPATFIGVPLLLLAAIALACIVPARRAGAVQPTEALRAE